MCVQMWFEIGACTVSDGKCTGAARVQGVELAFLLDNQGLSLSDRSAVARKRESVGGVVLSESR